MFKYKGNISSVKSFAISKERLIYASKNKVIDHSSNECILESENDLQEIYFDKNHFFVNDVYGNGFLIYDGSFRTFPSCFIKHMLDNFKSLVSYQKKTYLQNINTDELTFLFEERLFNFIVLNNNLIYIKNGIELIIRSITTNDILVEKSVSDYALPEQFKFTKIVGIYNDELYVGCNGGVLLAIDLNTGNLAHKWDVLPGFYTDVPDFANKMPPSEIFTFDEIQGKLVGLFIFSYVEIDLQTRAVTEYNLKEDLLKEGIIEIKGKQNYQLFNQYIVSVGSLRMKDNHPGFTYDCIFLFNRETKKIDWKYTFEGEGLGTNKPVIFENKLYQLDTGDTLHIFELV
jgi:hypothetical protein